MKKLFLLIAFIVINTTIFAQSPGSNFSQGLIEIGGGGGGDCANVFENKDYLKFDHTQRLASLQSHACELEKAIPTEFQSNWGSFIYRMPLIMAYASQEEGYDVNYAAAVAQVEPVSMYYFLIVEEWDEKDRLLNFRVKIKLPRQGAFAGIDDILEEAISTLVLKAIVNTPHGRSYDPIGAETSGLDKLRELLVSYLNGDSIFKNLEERLNITGFELVAENVNFTRSGGSGGVGYVKDYAGLKLDGQKIADNYAVGVNAAAQALELIGYPGPPLAVIFTDETNIIGPGKEFDNNATSDYGVFKSGSYLTLWFCYFSSTGKLYLKHHVNASHAPSGIEDLQAKFASAFPEISDEDLEPLHKPHTGRPEKSKNCNCSNLFAFSKSWRFGSNVMPCLNCELPEDGYPGSSEIAQAFAGLRKYQVGIGLGAMDGIIEMVSFLVDVGSTFHSAVEHTPGSAAWFGSLVKKLWNDGLSISTFREKFKEDANYWKSVIEGFTEFVAELTFGKIATFAKLVIDEIEKWVGKLVDIGNPMQMGYTHGKLAFEVILAYFTGGTRLAINVAGIGKTAAKGLLDAIRNPHQLGTWLKAAMADAAAYCKNAGGKAKAAWDRVVRNVKGAGNWIDEITEATKTHVLKGEINGSGNAVGCHFKGAIDNGSARIRPGATITEGPNDMFKVHIDVKDVNGNWIPKTAQSSFFPRTWTEQKILSEIQNAFSNKTFVSGNTWKGLSSEGIEIRMFLKTDGSNQIISAFPIF